MAGEYGAYIPEAGVAARATFVIDKDGKVAYKAVNHPGEMRDQEAIVTALAACPV
jgi:alkyl hydroperoxide reductase subunit AhpC